MSRDLIEELRNTFEYHPDGYLIRRKNRKPCGQRANHSKGYATVRVGRQLMYAHRIIYAIVHGEMPGEVDHIDGNPMNNRIENLRDVSHLENRHNYKMHKDNTSGFTGVYWHTQARKWHARIKVNGQRIHLGLFEDFEEAVQARKLAKIRYHPTSPEASRLIRELFPCGA